MQSYQSDFIELALKCNALSFGKYTLKSGRTSPYFFNMGALCEGTVLAKLGQFYAECISEAKVQFDILFGPAYKGIPLACTTSIALAKLHDKNIKYSFNRKEPKAHGEGGVIVGASLKGDVLIIDDVITAGTAIRETLSLIQKEGAKAKGVVIALDRLEKGQGDKSAVQEIEAEFNIPVISIITLDTLISYLDSKGHLAGTLDNMHAYRKEFGVAQ